MSSPEFKLQEKNKRKISAMANLFTEETLHEQLPHLLVPSIAVMTAPLRAKIRIAVKNLEALLQEDNTFRWEEDASKTATHNLNLLEAVSARASVRLKQVELQINKAYQAIENYTGEIMNLTAAKKAQESATFEKFMTDFRVESTMEEASKISSQLQDKIVNWKFTARKKAYQPEAAAKPSISYSSAVRLPLLQLINFSGVRAEWQDRKVLYLRSLLKKEAKDYIAGLSTEAANYSLAVELLNSKYDNKEERTRELHLQLLERRPCKCLNDCQKLVIFLAKAARQLKILEQEVEIPAVWLVLEQNLTHNGLPRKFLRAILEKRASDPEWNTSKFLEEFELLVKKEERLQSICNSSGAKTVYEASSDEECSDNDSESEYSESEQSEDELEGAELSCDSDIEELEKSALTVDTAESEDSSDEEDKVCSSSAPISEIKSSQREYHDEEIGDSTSMWAHCKNSAGDLKESEYSPDEEEYLDSSSESENESSSKECSEAEENQENSTTTWAYRAITTDEGQNPQQTLKTEEQQNRYGYCTNLFASPAKLDAEEDLSDNKCTQKEEIKSYRKTTFRVTTVEEKPTKRQRHQKEKHPEDRMSGAEKSRNKDETIYTSAALVFQEEKAQKSTTTAKRCRKVQRQSRVRRAASFRCSQKKVQNIDSLTKPRQKAVAKPRPRSRTICCNHRWTKKVRKKKKAKAKSCPKVKLKNGKRCNRTRKQA
uniref:Uncharacterized protein n=1 Tax=Ditylenchus dipsaci TaxID=166011 RepID=A0A915CSA7_9BILA